MIVTGPKLSWPVYFAAKPLNAPNIAIQKGDPFPSQDPFFIRQLGMAYGEKNYKTKEFVDLSYVLIVDVRTGEIEQQIRERGLRHADVLKLLERKDAREEAA